MLVVVVDLAYVGVGDDDVGEVAEGLDAVREAYGQERKGEARRRKESFCGERRTAMSELNESLADAGHSNGGIVLRSVLDQVS